MAACRPHRLGLVAADRVPQPGREAGARRRAGLARPGRLGGSKRPAHAGARGLGARARGRPHQLARAASLGNVWLAGRWMEHDNAMRAPGLVGVRGASGSRQASVRRACASRPPRRPPRWRARHGGRALAESRGSSARSGGPTPARPKPTLLAPRVTSDDYGIPIYGYGAIGYGNPLGSQPVEGCCGGSRHSGGFRQNHPHGGRPSAPAPQPTPRDRNPQTTIPSNQRARAPGLTLPAVFA